MNITVHPDGLIEYQDVTEQFALSVAQAAVAGRLTSKLVSNELKKKRGRPPEHEEVAPLNPAQLQTLQYLQAHDSAEGVKPARYAKDAQLDPKIAGVRLAKLVELGVAYKVGHGHYRVGEPE